MRPDSQITELDLIAPPPRFVADRRTPAQRDRRATPRVRAELECEERVGKARYFRITHDLSTFGLSTRLGYSHPLGERLQLVLHLPDDFQEPLRLEGVVVGSFDPRGGMRVAFRHPSVDAVKRLHRYLTRQSQLSEG